MLTLSTYFCENGPVTRKPPPYHRPNLRAALIKAGLELIQKKGVRALTLREIGSRQGVSRMDAYRHFRDKADLLAAISEAGFVEFAKRLETARAQAPDDFASRLTAMGIAYVRFAREHRAHFEVMFGPVEAAPPRTEAGARAFGILEQTIREGQQAGEVRPGDSVKLAQVAWALIHGVSVLCLDEKGSDFSVFADEILRLGLEPREAK
jgi:AcrR family transcriptional regulator